MSTVLPDNPDIKRAYGRVKDGGEPEITDLPAGRHRAGGVAKRRRATPAQCG
jgi:hypothetical protein